MAGSGRAISIVDHQLPDDDHNRYDVIFFDRQIPTLLTHSPSMVSFWLSQLPPPPRLVGLDVEWRPNFSTYSDHPIATIQLCTAAAAASSATSLIFQILQAPHVPKELADFLDDPANKFVGVGIGEDVEKLLVDYGLRVGNPVDLRSLAGKALKNAGLKTLAKEVLGKEVEKPKRVTRSRWDNPWLTPAQKMRKPKLEEEIVLHQRRHA
ncbi:Werner Syndrome-like exonuclease isoform X2 [Punica granatum]|uniref:Werner Syndrome-like exonuclease isoform X2 n=1 Tax=Punica granatum TaxID=22663 RepID=A0A6P8CIJ6_PUNGR|nr:Werner Syndrome-like exonuclease isoform X2 [Punica granatum]